MALLQVAASVASGPSRVAMATGGAAPSAELTATGGDAVEWVHRMLCPLAPLHRIVRFGLLMAMVLVAMLPLAIVALAWIEPVLTGCLSL